MFCATWALALLCLASVSFSAPPACEDLVRPLEQVDLHHLEGRWALIAGSLKDAGMLGGRESLAVDFQNSSYTQANLRGDHCWYYSHNISVEGHVLTMKVGDFNFTVTFLHTSCVDCQVLTLGIESPSYKTEEVHLFSRRREVEEEAMEEFRAQLKCLKMPPPVVMDPTKKLCPQQTDSASAA